MKLWEVNYFSDGRFSSGYGEEYDYNSILHYSATAFSKDNESVTLLPRVGEPDMIGKKRNLSDTDIVKIKKMYKCKPYEGWWVRNISRMKFSAFHSYVDLLAHYLVSVPPLQAEPVFAHGWVRPQRVLRAADLVRRAGKHSTLLKLKWRRFISSSLSVAPTVPNPAARRLPLLRLLGVRQHVRAGALHKLHRGRALQAS